MEMAGRKVELVEGPAELRRSTVFESRAATATSDGHRVRRAAMEGWNHQRRATFLTGV
jgi:hypothetical protein